MNQGSLILPTTPYYYEIIRKLQTGNLTLFIVVFCLRFFCISVLRLFCVSYLGLRLFCVFVAFVLAFVLRLLCVCFAFVLRFLCVLGGGG